MKHSILSITLAVLTFIVSTPRAHALFNHVQAEKERRQEAEQRVVQEQQTNGQLIQTNQGPSHSRCRQPLPRPIFQLPSFR